MIEITGTANLERMIVELGTKADAALPAALYQRAEAIMAKSRPQVPVDSGILRGSGHVSLPQRSGTGVVVTLGYGGAAQAYAMVQHEAADYNHPKGGKDHFLSDPVQEAAATWEADLVTILRGFLG